MIAVIFNPAARGEKARLLRRQLGSLGPGVLLRPTEGPGHAPLLAAEAAAAGCHTVVAAGGDGTVSEVVNGLAPPRDGPARVRLGVLPLGTINVFARELGLPGNLPDAWEIIRRGHSRRIDLPRAEFAGGSRWFLQLAGAGLDSAAIARVRWELKKRLGPLAYVWAGAQALHGPLPDLLAACDGTRAHGRLVLVGNGRLYGGHWVVFPRARMDDGRLDVAVVARVNWLSLARLALAAHRGRFPAGSAVRHLQGSTVELVPSAPLPFQLDGDNHGPLPVRFSLAPQALEVIVP